MTHARAAYSQADLARVVSVMQRHVGPANAAPIGVIADECGIDPRKVRAALSAGDGVLFLEAEQPALFDATEPTPDDGLMDDAEDAA